MNFIKKNLFRIVIIAFIAVLPILSLAQTPGVPRVPAPVDSASSLKIVNPIASNTISEFIETILKGIVRLGIPIIALAIVYCGFLFVAAQGNPEKITKAKSALLYTLIGAAILMGSYAIATLITETVQAL